MRFFFLNKVSKQYQYFGQKNVSTEITIIKFTKRILNRELFILNMCIILYIKDLIKYN